MSLVKSASLQIHKLSRTAAIFNLFISSPQHLQALQMPLNVDSNEWHVEYLTVMVNNSSGGQQTADKCIMREVCLVMMQETQIILLKLIKSWFYYMVNDS